MVHIMEVCAAQRLYRTTHGHGVGVSATLECLLRTNIHAGGFILAFASIAFVGTYKSWRDATSSLTSLRLTRYGTYLPHNGIPNKLFCRMAAELDFNFFVFGQVFVIVA
jgi:hypothetical protein